MKRSLTTTAAAAFALTALLAPTPSPAQSRTTGGVRGKVVDEAGQPIEGVRLDLEFKGETRRPLAYFVVSNKKGGFIRTGLPGGRWKLLFTKEGFQPYGMETELYSGGFSDMPDIVMKAAAVAAPAAPAPNEVVPEMPKDAGTMKDVYNQAVEATRAGNHDEAEVLYKQILEKLPDMSEIHYNLGHVYVAKKDLDSAEASFRRAVELQPSRPDPYVALSAIFAAHGKVQEAAEFLIQGAPHFEQDAKYQFALGTNCVNAGKSKEAADAFRKVLALDPANAEAHFHLGTVLVGENKVADAVAELGKYIEAGKDPENLATAKGIVAALAKKK
jgi:Flp pilus assembly protein TadD